MSAGGRLTRAILAPMGVGIRGIEENIKVLRLDAPATASLQGLEMAAPGRGPDASLDPRDNRVWMDRDGFGGLG